MAVMLLLAAFLIGMFMHSRRRKALDFTLLWVAFMHNLIHSLGCFHTSKSQGSLATGFKGIIKPIMCK